jgi:hypothetical protein
MTQMVLDLPAELYERLHSQAQRLGKPSKDVVRDLLAEHLPQPAPIDERTRIVAVLRDAGLLADISPEEKRRAAECTVTLEEVQAALDSVDGPPLSELIIEMRGPKL